MDQKALAVGMAQRVRTGARVFRTLLLADVALARKAGVDGKLDIAKCATYWLKDADKRGMKHICWDGCMFPNEVLMKQQTWNDILAAMIAVRNAQGY